MRTTVQSFLAGFAVPAIAFMGLSALLIPQGTFYFFRLYPFHALPFIWGIWNVLYYYAGRHIILLKKPGVWGALLGLSTSLAGVFLFDTLHLYQKLYSALVMQNVLLLETVIYFILWETLVRYFNYILID